ncbi:glycosyltransferase family 69 protein [Aaosphaeria arxii CBS 175.79]|uniref:Glycosyltransferase family 69 protein n=1 Tax=Aaosphaeria arxii CBS 175.79 TaxID=1450172 RepID=A0A6A5Y6P5_9PLEO|nr:glycosyltransferase family 69 protein [Aaosphaeria arxii CBS 175.79]KAF2020480.1 glycosyltransferase family 69 protein [Aaosphaeria arxii CBS 175.79]
MPTTRSVRALFQALILLSAILLLLVGFGYYEQGYTLQKFQQIAGSVRLPGVGSHPAEVAAPSASAESVASIASIASVAPTTSAVPQPSTPAKPAETPVAEADKNEKVEEAPQKLPAGDPVLLEQAQTYVKSIMDFKRKGLQRLECPALDENRFAYLRPQAGSRPKYFFALDLYKIRELLPSTLGAIVETMKFLGPKNCVLSIVEGRSTDGTYEVLKELEKEITKLGSRYFLQTSDINPKGEKVDRIKALAELRNMAMKDLIDNPEHYAENTTVIFSNDVSLCPEDVLELLHQRVYQGADHVCAMDWRATEDPTFYDVWIARDMSGDTFFRIEDNGAWTHVNALFPGHPATLVRYNERKPFQVFSCWNGIVAFTAEPIMQKTIKFRGHYKGEAFQGEPKLFDKDLWYYGYGKIAVVPSVNVAYDNPDNAIYVKKTKGYASESFKNETPDHKINWDPAPPALVKHMPTHTRQKFIPWDEGLPEKTELKVAKSGS